MKTVLLVDDSPTMLMSLEGILQRAGYGTAKATSGEDAERQLTSGGLRPQGMITDLNMGAMDGIGLIAAARRLAHCRFIPILMLTTESQPEKRLEAKKAGATGWLVKPVGPDDLVKVMQQVLPKG